MASVATVYARAIFEVTQENGEPATVLQELKDFQEACSANKLFQAVMLGPVVDPNRRKAILQEVTRSMGASNLAVRFLELLLARGRMAALSEIVGELENFLDGKNGVQRGEVRSAIELSADEIHVLGSALSKRIGKKVKLNASVDPDLLGGVVAIVAGKTFDASLRAQIEKFKNNLMV